MSTEPEDSAFGELLPRSDLDRSDSRVELVTEFKPWHHPRKQHVRQKQWNAAVEALIEELTERPIISYLGLPGEDLLDIGSLAELCHKKKRRLKYLGYDTSLQSPTQSTQRVVSKQIVELMPAVESGSQIIPDDISSIAKLNSNGYRSLKNGGTYDVVNLDLCDSFTSEAAPLHAALMTVLHHQINWRAQPWLLFLTTRSEFDRVSATEQAAYLRLLSSNAANSVDFHELVGKIVGQALSSPIPVEELKHCCRANDGLSGRLLSLGIGKWLAGLSNEAETWRVDLLSIWSYRTGMTSNRASEFAHGPPNLFSLAFRFTKIAAASNDPIGLASPIEGGKPPSETQLAVKMAKCVHQQTRDIDSDLAADAVLLSELQVECEGLLQARNYSLSHYRDWLAPAVSAAPALIDHAS